MAGCLLVFSSLLWRVRLFQTSPVARESRTRRIPSFQIFLAIALIGFLSNFRKPLQCWLHASSCWSPRSLPGARHHRLFKNPTIKPRITTQAIPMQSMLEHALNVSVHVFNLALDSAWSCSGRLFFAWVARRSSLVRSVAGYQTHKCS